MRIFRDNLVAFLFLAAFSICFMLSCHSRSGGTDTEDAGSGDSDAAIANPGFESENSGWKNLRVGEYDYYAPVEGKAYAVCESGSNSTTQTTNTPIQAGKTYTLTIWARSIYSEEVTECLRDCDPENIPLGSSSKAEATVELLAENLLLAASTKTVSPKPLKGAPEIHTNDDGGNVWVDGEAGFRHGFSENHFYQPIDSDPIDDPWFLGDMPLALEQADMMAKAAVIFPDGVKRLYGFNSDNPYCQGTGENCQAILFATVEGDGIPQYTIPNEADENYVVWNAGDEDPWLGDPHVFADDDSEQIWLTFGGGTGIYVSELDPDTGFLKGTSGPISFDEHSELFTKVADWSGDEWTFDSEWFEGAALYRHGEYWYLFTSNGDLSLNYTIRMGRGESPTGPFFDKVGRNMKVFDEEDHEYGNSFLLGDDGGQLVPGHPHIWEEAGRFYFGYDYRTGKEGKGENPFFDYLGIRRLNWVNGWPTIWMPITVEFDADDHPQAIGRQLEISLRNSGDESSIVAFDWVILEVAN